MMTTTATLVGFLLLLGLGFFFGIAFEEFHAHGGQPRPGGVRSFPLLALVGALLYRLDPHHLLLLTAGLLVLGAWLTCYYWRHIAEIDPEGQPNIGLMTAICNVLAYLLGPIVFAEPPWVAIGVTVVAVLLLTAREKLHGFARQLEVGEIVTAGKFLILSGLVLPFLPNEPVTPLTQITPYQVWLAVLAVCSISYASYLLQRYVVAKDSGLWLGALGGLYSSTATTVVLARHARAEPSILRQAQTGIVLANSVMFLRVLVIIGLFDRPLASTLAPALLALTVLGLVLARICYRTRGGSTAHEATTVPPPNPLELTTALVFAASFVAVSLAAAWVRAKFGEAGLFGLAAIVGFTDINPFVLSIAAAGAMRLPTGAAAATILVAAASNNLLQAIYATVFAGTRLAIAPAAALIVLALSGVGAAWWITSGTVLP